MIKTGKKKSIFHKGLKCILSLSILLSGFALDVFQSDVNAQQYTKVYKGVQNKPIALNDGVYLFDNVTVKGNSSQPSAVIVEGKVTIVIEGNNSVMGYDARWIGETQYASGAGFQVEKQGSYSSELIIRGEKSASLYVKGGNANKGEDGVNGGDGYENRSPGGGRGGNGGNGGSSAIGGRGGVIGSPKGRDAGKISLLGAFTLTTDAGKGGAGGRGGNGGRSDGDWNFFTTALSAGGGGGGGGGGGFPGVDIGGGGAAGDQGGNGGSGSGLRTTTLSAFSKEAGAGGGGGRGWGAGGGGGTGFFAYYIAQPKWSSIRPQGGKGGTDPDHRGEGGQVGIMEATLPGSGSDAGAYVLRVGSYSGDVVSVDDDEGSRNNGFIETTRNASTEPQQRRHGARFGGSAATRCDEYSMWGGYGSDCAWAFIKQGGGETPEAKSGHGMGRRYELWIQNGGATDGGRGENSIAGSGPIEIDKSENITWPDQGETGNGGGADKEPGEDVPVIRTVIDLSHPDTKITFTPPVGVYDGNPVNPQISIVSSTGINVDPNAYDIYTIGDLKGPGTVTYRFVGKGESYEGQWVENETTREYTIEKGNMNAHIIESDNFYTRRLLETFNVEIVGYKNDNNNVTWSVEPDPSTPDVEFTVTPNTKPGITITSTNNVGKIIVKATISEGDHYKEITTQPITLIVVPQGADLFTISKIDDQRYTGSEIKPEFTVNFGNTQLVEGIDYTFTYEDNVEVGRAKVTVIGIGNYEGTFTSYFNIVPADISPIIFKNADYSTTPPTLADLYYTSYPQISQPLDGRLDGKELVEGKDYLVSYSNMTEVGKVIVTVVGIGNYTNSTTLEYEILPTEIDKIAGLTINRPENIVYDGTAKQQKPTVMLNGRILKEGVDYTLSYENNIKAGTATVIITGKGNFTGDSQMKTQFQILQRPIYVVPEDDQWKFSGDNEPVYKYHLKNVVQGDVISMKNEGTITRESGDGVGEYRFLLGELGLDYGKDDNDNYVLYMSPDIVNFKVKSFDTDKVAIIRGEIIDKETGERAVVNGATGWYNNIVEVVAPEGYLISRSPNKDPEGTPVEGSFWQPYFSSEDGDFSKDGEGMTYYLMKIPEKEGDKSLISQAKQVKYKQDTIAPSSRIEMNQKKIYTEYKKDLKFDTYFQNDVNLDIISSDVTSGILSNDYYLADREYTKQELDRETNWVSKAEAQYQLTLNTEMKKIMYLRTIDVAGNVTYVNTDGFIIDKTAPFITIEYPKAGVWVTGKDSEVKVNVNETLSGVDERYVDYHFEYSDGRVSDPQIIKLDKDGNAIIKDLPDGDYKLVVTAKDKAGNSYSDETHVMIDTIQPTLELKGNITSYETSKDIDIIANVGPSLVDKVYVQKQNYGDPYDENGTWVEITNEYNQNNHKYNVDENGTYYVKYVNGAGVESNIASISFDTIDKTKPLVRVNAITVSDGFQYLSNTWTKDNVKVYFNNTEFNLGNTKYSYRIKKATDLEWSDWQSVVKKNDYEASVLISQSGEFHIEMKITSESGMESSVSDFIVKIDKQLPTGQISLVNKTWKDFLSSPVFDNFYNTNQDYVIKPKDELSGVLSVQYILLKDNEAKTSYTLDTIEDLATSKNGWTAGTIDALTNEVKVSITSDATYVIYVKITDAVGNIRYISSDGAIIDATKPTLIVNKDVMEEYDYPASNTKWITDSSAILPTTLTDSLSGQDKLIFQYLDGINPIRKEVDISSGSYDIGELPEGIYDLIVDGYDKAGNKVSETVAIKKDSVTPDVNFTADTVNLGKKKHVDIEPVVGTSGLKKVEYQYVPEGGTFDENGPWIDITNDYNKGLDIIKNGTLHVRVENNLGITSDKSLSFGNIQEVPVKIIVDTVDEDGILVAMNNGWYPAIDVRFYNDPRLVSDLVYEYHTGDGQWKTVTSIQDGYALIKAPEGETTYTVRISNPETGVSESASITVKVDATKPTGELTTTASHSRVWLNANNTTTINYGLTESVDVVLKNVKDAVNSSGLNSVEYYIMTAGKNTQLTDFPKDVSEVKTQLTDKWIRLNEAQMESLKDDLPVILTNLKIDQEYIVYVRVKDIAGNIQYITSDGISIDATKPVIETDYVDGTWLTDNTKIIQVKIKDNLSGVKSGTYTISNDLNTNTYNYNCQNREGEFTIPVSQFEEGKSTLTINATDVAGNVANSYSVGILKDTVKPVIHINQGNSTTHQVGIIVDTIGASDIKEVYVTCDNGVFEKMDITPHYGEGIQIPRNGTYTYVLVNNAGVSSEPVSITIDDMGEPPIVSVQGINGIGDIYSEGTWSHSEVSMQVTVENLQIGKSTYEYSLDGKTWTVMSPDANGEYWITQQESGEFTYRFRVTAADGARSNVIEYNVKVDTTVPEFTYEITPNEYTNLWVDIIIHPKNESDTLSYSFDGGETYSKQKEKRFISNGYVDLVVKNETGTKSEKTAKIDNIDRLSPLMTVYENQVTDKNMYRVELGIKDAPENLDFIETGVDKVFITNQNPYSENDVRTKPLKNDYVLEKEDNQHYVTKGEFKAELNGNETDNYWIIATDNVGNYKIKSFRVSPDNKKVEEQPDPEQPIKPTDPEKPKEPTEDNEGTIDKPGSNDVVTDILDKVENIENTITKTDKKETGELLIKRQEKLDVAVEQMLRNLPKNKADQRRILEEMLKLNLTNQQRQFVLNQLEALKEDGNIYIWIWIPIVILAIVSGVTYEYKKKRLEKQYEDKETENEL